MTDIATVITLPRQLTPLVGRQQELDVLQEMLVSTQRLVTITGIGGIGKTRLAQQVAMELEPSFPAGALFVALAEIRDATQIPFEISRLIGAANPTADIDDIVAVLGPEPRLVILDNLEQIREAGDFVMNLLERHPNLTMLCTSQIPLETQVEQIFPLNPMATPDTFFDSGDGSLASTPSVELFLQRARAVNPHQHFDADAMSIVGEICRMLDGIPLAIELAAGRTTILAPAELKARLSNRLEVLGGGSRHLPDRLRTMRDAIAWSYGLLDEDEKRMFRYVGVFAGSIGVDAIEHTLQTLEVTDSALDTLDFLVTRGLLHRVDSDTDTPRYHMLQTLREYATEQLRNERDEFGARLSHANYVVDLTETARPFLSQNNQEHWFRELNANRDNIRTAAEWALEQRPELTARIVAAIWLEADFRGTSQQFIALGRKAMQADLPDKIRARCLMGIGIMQTHLRDDLDSAEASLQESLKFAQLARDPYSEVRALTGLGTVDMHQERYDEALDHYREAELISTRHDDHRGVFSARANIAAIASYKNDYERSLEIQTELLRQQEAEGNPTSVARLQCNIGMVHNYLGNFREAIENHTRAIEVARDLDNIAIQLYSLLSLGEAHMMLNEYDSAQLCFEEGIRVARKTGRLLHEVEFRTAVVVLAAIQGEYIEAIRGIPPALTVTSNNQAVLEIVHCAAVLMMANINAGNRKEAALFTEAVVDGKRTLQPIADFLAEPCAAFKTTIPDNPAHPERIAYEAGKSLSISELTDKAIAMANDFLQAAGRAPVHASPVEPTIALTPREHEVLGMMAKGHTNAEIAEGLYISLRTITTHVGNIFNKLDVSNRSTAVAVALSKGLVTL